SDETTYTRMINPGVASVRYVSDRHITVKGMTVNEIKRVLDAMPEAKGGRSWQDMFLTPNHGGKFWIGCFLPGTAPSMDIYSITPGPQNGSPTTAFVVEQHHPMSYWEVRWVQVKNFGKDPFR